MAYIKITTAHGKILESELEINVSTPEEVVEYLFSSTLQCNINNQLVNIGNGKFVEAYDISIIEVTIRNT